MSIRDTEAVLAGLRARPPARLGFPSTVTTRVARAFRLGTVADAGMVVAFLARRPGVRIPRRPGPPEPPCGSRGEYPEPE